MSSTEDFEITMIIEDVPKHVGPNLVFADDDQQKSQPGRLAKHPAFGLLLSPAGYLTQGRMLCVRIREGLESNRRIRSIAIYVITLVAR